MRAHRWILMRLVAVAMFLFHQIAIPAGLATASAAEAVAEEEIAEEEITEEEPAEKEVTEEARTIPDEPEAVPDGAFQPVNSTSPALAIEEPLSQEVQPGTGGLDERVSLDLRNIEVSEALRFIALKGGLNMAISKNVAGRVQLLLNNVPIRDILDIILITNGLALEKIGDIYYIMSDTEYKERFGRKFSDAREVRLFKLRYAVPEQAFALFEVLKSEIGRLLVDPESGTVLVMDSKENIARMENALKSLEEKKAIKVYALKYAKALDVETRLKTKLDNKKVGTVTADERTNSVIVETLPDRVKEIDDLVTALDQKTKEVLIDAKIIKITVNDQYDAEIKWEAFFEQMNSKGVGFIGNHPFEPLARAGTSFVDNFVNIAPTARPTAGAKNEVLENLFFGTAGEDSFEVLIKYLKTIGTTKILSNPKIAVINNQEAKIHVGAKQAYVTTTTTTGQTTTTTAESVTFVDIGIQLNVTPIINDDGYVTMKIKPEISSVVDFLVTPSGNRIPIIDSSLAETAVMVKDGVSIIIGGLRRDEEVSAAKKVPFLGDIPFFGAPFKSSSKDKIHTELLILITPHIVEGDKLLTGDKQPGEMPYMSYGDYTPYVETNRKDPAPSAVAS